MEERKRRLAIYVRTSVDKDDFTTSIEQQIEEGKKFASENNFPEYEVFCDKGVSAYKLIDESDPFYTREQFKKLIEKVNKKYFTDLWIWETSRLSRNDLATQKILTILKRENIILHTKSQQFDLKNIEDKFHLSILTAFSTYERDLIVSRTSRGLYKAIDEGKRSFSHFYGYEKSGFKNGNFTYKVDERKLEQVKQAYELFLEGKSLRQIAEVLEEKKLITTQERLKLSTKWGRILAHEEYTSYALNLAGMEVEKQFSKGEIGSLIQLHEKEKYWVKSKVYKEEIISIENWIICREKLQIYKQQKSKNKNNYSVSVEKYISSGLIKCSDCGCGFFVHKNISKYKGKTNSIPYYKHYSLMYNKECSQSPKTIKVEKLDNIMRFFYVFQSLVFNDRQTKSKEINTSLNNEKKNINSQITTSKAELHKYSKLLKIADEKIIENPDLFIEITRQQKIYNEKIIELEKEINNQELKLIELQRELEENEKLLTFKLSQKQIYDFLYNYDKEQQRNLLSKKIELGLIYGIYILIKSQGLYFIFKIDKNEKPEINKDGSKSFKTYPIPEFLFSGINKDILNFWNRYKNDDLDYKNPETQEYLRTLFNWKKFIVTDENIDLDVKIDIPEHSTVIYFDETTTLDEKRIKARETKKRYREKQKLLKNQKSIS